MACEGSPDCCKETTDHILMGRGPQGLNEDIDGRCYNCSTETNCISVTNNCN